MTASPDPIITNAYVFRDIAAESLQASEALTEAHRRPKEDGTPGYILSSDAGRRSFKLSLIAIVFAGMFIEASLWLYGSEKLGADQYKPIDRRELEKRLRALGIEDADLEAKLRAYREVRRELVHEKALPFSSDPTPIRVAQKEARKAVELMFRVESALRGGPPHRSGKAGRT